ncbi:MAG TPA: hypothetical protein VG895_02950 [Patescibacteria group bacterium]|nr:hypothetical protein [Patescibacteria group bacterium]
MAQEYLRRHAEHLWRLQDEKASYPDDLAAAQKNHRTRPIEPSGRDFDEALAAVLSYPLQYHEELLNSYSNKNDQEKAERERKIMLGIHTYQSLESLQKAKANRDYAIINQKPANEITTMSESINQMEQMLSEIPLEAHYIALFMYESKLKGLEVEHRLAAVRVLDQQERIKKLQK